MPDQAAEVDVQRRFRLLALDICFIAIGSIVLLVAQVPVSTFFVLSLFGFCLSIVIGLVLFGFTWLVFREPSTVLGRRNEIAAVCFPVVPMIALVVLDVQTALDYPTRGALADLILVLALTFIVVLAAVWVTAMLIKSISDRAWTTSIP